MCFGLSTVHFHHTEHIVPRAAMLHMAGQTSEFRILKKFPEEVFLVLEICEFRYNAVLGYTDGTAVPVPKTSLNRLVVSTMHTSV